jgi:hypothetical protein
MPELFPGPMSLVINYIPFFQLIIHIVHDVTIHLFEQRYILHLCIISFTTFETLFNYCACVMTPPGRPTELSTDVQSVFGSVSEIIDGRRIVFTNHTIEIKPGVMKLHSTEYLF